MTLKAYIWIVRLVAVFSLSAFLSVLFLVDPLVSGWAGKILFFLILLLVTFSLAHWVIIVLKKRYLGETATARSMRDTIRQSFLVGLLFTTIAIFQIFRIVIWWDILIVISILLIAEIYFRIKKD